MILSVDGEKCILPRQITQKFGDFYSSLYNLHLDTPDQSAVDDYLASSRIPGLTSIAQQELESPVTL